MTFFGQRSFHLDDPFVAQKTEQDGLTAEKASGACWSFVVTAERVCK
jgi:hypothetical protein